MGLGLWKYYFEKAAARLRTATLARDLGLTRSPGLIEGGVGAPPAELKRVVFYFHPAALFHLGDQLFNQPVIEALLAEGGPSPLVVTASPLGPYFRACGAEVIAPGELSGAHLEGTLVVTKSDLLPEMTKLGMNFRFLGMDYGRIPSPEPIATWIHRKINAQGGKADFVPRAPRLPQGLPGSRQGVPPGRWLAYNDFVASDLLRAGLRRPLLRELARKKREEGFKLVYLGTESERLSAPETPEFIDLDLRGQIPTLEIFHFLARPEIEGLLSFDTFIAHAATLAGKDLYVVMKNRGKAVEFRRKFLPMCVTERDLVRVCI